MSTPSPGTVDVNSEALGIQADPNSTKSSDALWTTPRGYPKISRIDRARIAARLFASDRSKSCRSHLYCVETGATTNRFFRKLGVEYVQYIPIAEFQPGGAPRLWSVTAQEYGCFLAETFRLWWPNRRLRIRFFDNLAEALAGLKPGSCSLHDSCDSYCVVEHNGDVYPCDFFVREEWKLGNVNDTSFGEIARHGRRFEFATRKALPHSECEECKYASICRRGCPKLREGRLGRFEDLDYFCQAYKTAFRVAVPKLRKEVEKLGYPAQN